MSTGRISGGYCHRGQLGQANGRGLPLRAAPGEVRWQSSSFRISMCLQGQPGNSARTCRGRAKLLPQIDTGSGAKAPRRGATLSRGKAGWPAEIWKGTRLANEAAWTGQTIRASKTSRKKSSPRRFWPKTSPGTAL